LTSFGMVGAMAVAVVGLSAGSAFATSLGPIAYEADCTTPLQAGTVAPFVIVVNGDTNVNSAFPNGAKFGATGTVTTNLSGGFIAGLEANGFGTGGLVTQVSIGATKATGTYAINGTAPSVTWDGRQIGGVSWGSGSTTLSGPFVAGDAGHFVSGTNIPPAAVIVGVNPGVSATITAATTGAGSGNVGTGAIAGQNYTIPFTAPNTTFTTSGNATDTASLNLVSAEGFQVQTTLNIGFGGAFGGACTVTGYDSGGNPGPGQTPAPGPVLPNGTVNPLVTVSPVVTAPFATLTLTDGPPAPQAASVALGIGGNKNVQLLAPDTDGTPAIYWEVTTGSSLPRLNVGLNSSTGVATLTDSGVGPATATFSFTACDQQNGTGTVTPPPGVNCGAPAVVTVNIGTPPVDETLTQAVGGAQLMLSCSAPEVYQNPSSTGIPSLQCPNFALPAITLNGLEQTTQGAGSTLYVSDNRGDPAGTWTLTATMVASQTGGAGQNPNASCAGIVAFCNGNVGSNALNVATNGSKNGQISAANLLVAPTACGAHVGNLNPAGTLGAGGTMSAVRTICTASVGQSGGTFDVTKNYTLTIPSSVYAGTYWGTVEYTVS
jgi:hypothetical protein